MCLKYQATENLRKSCYNWKRDEKSVQARLAIRPVLWKMVDTPTCIIGGMALLMALGRVSGADFLKMLGLGGFLPLDRALEKADAVCPAGYVLYRNPDAQRVRFVVS